jgi:hypothetical protein
MRGSPKAWLALAALAGALGAAAACTCPDPVFLESGTYFHAGDPIRNPDDVDRTLELDLPAWQVRISYERGDQTVVETWHIADRQPPE